MSRDLEDSVYYISRGGNMPIKWTAPEVCIVMNVGRHVHQTDLIS